MRRALRRAAHTLLAAGALGLPRPAVAQTSPSFIPTTHSTADAGREGRGRLEELKVELALLAEPTTFPFPIAARTVDGRLELRGQVPNETLEGRALRVARKHTHLPVADALQLNVDLAMPIEAVSADAVRQGAVEVLTEAYGLAARGFEIRVESGGQVCVNGGVNSVEDKVAVSRKLRQVRGCTCVANYLLVSPMMRDGKMVTQINSSGTMVVPGQVLCLDGTGQEAPTRVAAAPPSAPPSAPTVEVAAPAPIAPLPPPVVAPAPTPLKPMTPAVTPPAALPNLVAPPATQPTVRPMNTVVTAPAVAPVPLPIPAPLPVPVPLPAPARTATVPAEPVVPRLLVPGRFEYPPPVPEEKSIPLPQVVPPPPPSGNSSALRPMTGSATVATATKMEVDLLATPTVPPAWSQPAAETPTTTAPKKATTGPSKFAMARAEQPKPAADELLNLPAAPKVVKDPVAVMPMPVTPLPKETMTAKPAPSMPAAPRMETTATVVKPAPIPPAPMPSPIAPAAGKMVLHDTWVEAVAAPKPAPNHVAPPPGGWPAAHVAKPTPTAYVTSGVVVFPDDEEPVKPVRATVKPTAEPAKAMPVAEPMVPLPRPAPMPPAPIAMTTPASTALKQKVEKACGKLARDVQVTSDVAKGLNIIVKCANSDVAQQVTERVLQLPELLDPKVKLEVYVGP